ncbi:sigma-70 family RNA polymerase sigma factor [soil metagenome]
MGDAELVRAAQNGDAVSLGILLERHRAPLYALALRILGRTAEAQDAVQDTCLIALNNIDRLREPKAVGGWLRGIVHNVCLRHLRKKRGEVLLEDSPHCAKERSFESSAEEYIDCLAMREWVWTALYELPETLRVTAMLRYFGSYSSYEEISSILGVPVGTVRSRLNRVKVKLAGILLETAGLAHDEARKLTESRVRYFGSAWGGYNRGHADGLMSAFSNAPVLAFSDGTILGGRDGHEWLAEELEGDMEAGMKLHLTSVIASKDITVVEGDYENPRDDPFRCPPAISMVHFHSEEKVGRLHLYLAPRPSGQDD